jgi:hypothetical protein
VNGGGVVPVEDAGSGRLAATLIQPGGETLQRVYRADREVQAGATWLDLLTGEVRAAALVTVTTDALQAAEGYTGLELDLEAVAQHHDVAVAVVGTPKQVEGVS